MSLTCQRWGSNRGSSRPVPIGSNPLQVTYLPSTQIDKFMSCTQIMFSSNTLHVEDNLSQYYLYGKKVTVVGFEPGFDSDLFETLSRPLPVGCRCGSFPSNIHSTQVNKVMTLFKATGVWTSCIACVKYFYY